MVQSLKYIKNRIRSIENTKKVTAAMEMISVAKLNRVERMLYATRAYFTKLDSLVNDLVSSYGSISSPFLEPGAARGRIILGVVTSDAGLCGTYNNNVMHFAEEFINEKGKDKVKLVLVGKKGFNYFRNRRFNIENSFIGLNGRFSQKVSDEIVNLFSGLFLKQEAGEVYIAYMHFGSTIIHKPVLEKLFNIEAKSSRKIEYILEPKISQILAELIPRYISAKMRLVLLEAFTCEHAARSVAMKSATDNAKELLEKLTILRNKVRQANITQEIMEIISSAEALKG